MLKVRWKDIVAIATLRTTADRYQLREIIDKIESKIANLTEVNAEVSNTHLNYRWIDVDVNYDIFRVIFDFNKEIQVATIVVVAPLAYWKNRDQVSDYDVNKIIEKFGRY